MLNLNFEIEKEELVSDKQGGGADGTSEIDKKEENGEEDDGDSSMASIFGEEDQDNIDSELEVG